MKNISWRRPCGTSAHRCVFLCLFICSCLATGAGADPPQPPWTAVDVGKPVTAGVADIDSRGLWTIRSEHPPVSTRTDGLYLVHQPLVGDGSVVGMLVGLANGDGNGVAGIALRESDKAGARGLFLGMRADVIPTLRVRSASRKAEATLSWDRRYGPGRLPIWLRWQREGNLFTPFASEDGYGWTQLHAPITLARFPAAALAGMATASAPRTAITAVFNSPTVVPGQVSPRVMLCTGNGSALLSWTPVAGAVGYMVRRAAPQTAAFGAIPLTPEPIQETTFSENGLPNGRATRYFVSAVSEKDGALEEGWATAVTVTPSFTPHNLFGCDLNPAITAIQGSVAYEPATETYRVSGAGDATAPADTGFLAGSWVTGDFQITIRLLDRPGNLAGLVVREELQGPSRLFGLAGTRNSGLRFFTRTRAGTAVKYGKPSISAKKFAPPVFLRLVRRGAVLTAYYSLDNQTFKRAGNPVTFRPALPDGLYVGAVVSGSNIRSVTTHRFSTLTFGPPAPQ